MDFNKDVKKEHSDDCSCKECTGGNGMNNCQGGMCGGHGCGMWRGFGMGQGCCRHGGSMLLRLVLGVIILTIVFSLGVMIGEMKSYSGNWRGGNGMMQGYGYQGMPMMRGYYVGTSVQKTAPVAPAPAK